MDRDMFNRPWRSTITRFAARVYLFQGRRTFPLVPECVRRLAVGRAYGRQLQRLIQRYSDRDQNHSTLFLRNPPELELMRRLLDEKPLGATVDICVLACSKGAEVYSIAWKLRSARPDLTFRITAVDISQEIVDFAAAGAYTFGTGDARKALDTGSDLTWRDQRMADRPLSLFERMTSKEMSEMFDIHEGQAKIKRCLQQGITWLRADATDPGLCATLGIQDIVVANRFLCHMKPAAAEGCLRNIVRLVKPGGYLFVSGIDLDVRTAVAQDLGWRPVMEMIREVHHGDYTLIKGWPLNYWGLEPFSNDTSHWNIRYASVFQIEKLSRNASVADPHQRGNSAIPATR
jgi:chemotaxis methyl-accepting protein methylase